MTTPIIKLDQVTKHYGQRTVLDRFSMTVNRGDFAALIGPSGAGKSTILNIIGLLEEFDGGSYRLNGKRAPAVNSRQAMLARRNEINYLFQTFALVSNMTVRQNLELALNFSATPKKQVNAAISAILAEVELAGRHDDIVATMSVGEKQRVALARTFLKPGELILADEPTGSLDPQLAAHVLDLIQNLRRKHRKTVLMVTHDMTMAKAADYAVSLTRAQE